MSHFAVLVAGDDPINMLDPYDENIMVDSIITKEELIEREKRMSKFFFKKYDEYMSNPIEYEKHSHENHINFLKEEVCKMKLWEDEEWHKYALRYYDDEDIREDGGVNSTYNNNSKYDWYQIGGRWSGMLRLKEGSTGKLYEKSWCHKNDEIDPMMVDSAKKCDIDWEHKDMKNFLLSSFLGEDGWIEMHDVDTSSVVQVITWKDEFKKLIDSVDDDVMLTVVDCHI